MCVAMEKSLIRLQRVWVNGFVGGWSGPWFGKVADVMHGRTAVDRAANLHGSPAALVERTAPLCERAAALGALHERATMHARAGAGALCERAGEKAAALCGIDGALCALHGRAALHERAGERAAALCGRAGTLGALQGRAGLCEIAEVGALHESAGAVCERAGILSGQASVLG